MPQIIINNLIVNYQKTGFGETDFIMLHGWGCYLNIFNNLVSRIDKNKYTVYSLDFPGFGKSQMPKEVYGVWDYADFLKEFINKLEIKNPIILGHSFGGRVAIKFTSDYPTVAKKLILTGSAGIKKELKKSYLTIAKIGKIFFKLPFLKKYKNKILKKIGARDLAQSGEKENILRKVVNQDLQEDAKKIKIPTLLIYGINDEETPVEYGKIFKDLIPNSRLKIIKNAGHYAFLDQEKIFIEAIGKFLHGLICMKDSESKQFETAFNQKKESIFLQTQNGSTEIAVEEFEDTTALIFPDEITLYRFFAEKLRPNLIDKERNIHREIKERILGEICEYLMCFKTKDFKKVIEPIVRKLSKSG